MSSTDADEAPVGGEVGEVDRTGAQRDRGVSDSLGGGAGNFHAQGTLAPSLARPERRDDGGVSQGRCRCTGCRAITAGAGQKGRRSAHRQYRKPSFQREHGAGDHKAQLNQHQDGESGEQHLIHRPGGRDPQRAGHTQVAPALPAQRQGR